MRAVASIVQGGKGLAVEGHPQSDNLVPSHARRKSKGPHEEAKLHRDDHKTPIDDGADRIDPIGHPPFDDTLGKLEERAIPARTHFAMPLSNRKPRPLEDARTPRRPLPAQIVQNICQKMRPRRRQQTLVADNLVIAQAYLVNGMRIVKLIVLKAVWMAQVGPALLLNENTVPEPVDSLHQRGLSADFGAG